MKFRDPKTREVFEDIGTAHSRFCGSADSGKRCDECPLNVSRTGHGCVNFRNAHPAEAARRMGFEVVDDTPDAAMLVRVERWNPWWYETQYFESVEEAGRCQSKAR